MTGAPLSELSNQPLHETSVRCGHTLLIVEMPHKVCQRKRVSASRRIGSRWRTRDAEKAPPPEAGWLWIVSGGLLLEFDHHHFHGLVAEIFRQVLSSIGPNRIVGLAAEILRLAVGK